MSFGIVANATALDGKKCTKNIPKTINTMDPTTKDEIGSSKMMADRKTPESGKLDREVIIGP
jgi:hypothetical protein